MRPVIDMYLLFAILLAITLDRSKTAVRTSVILLSSCFILLNLLQSWQYSKGMIHPFNMDASKYAYMFLRTDPALADSIGGSDEIPWYGTRLDKCCFAFSEKNVVIDSNSLYNTGPNLHGTDLPFIPGRYFVKGDFYVRDLDRGASNTIYFVITIEEVDSVRNFWYGFRINDLPWYDTVSWRPVHFTLNTPVISYRDAYIKTFLWNPSGQRLKVAYFSLMFYPVGQGASRFQEYDSIGRHSLLPADKTELFARLGLDR
jgi:hypothetical protein